MEFHQHASRAAQAARCAGEQGQFWKMREVLLASVNNLTPEAIQNYAQRLSLDLDRFRTCLDSQKYQAALKIVGALPSAAFDARLTELSGK